MSQNIILTPKLNHLINKRALLELKSHWNNINMVSLEGNMSSSTFTSRNEECRKFFTCASNRLRNEKVRFFMHYCIFFLSTVSLSFFRYMSAVCCLPVCLSVCVRVYAGVIYSKRLIFDIPNGRQSKFLKKFRTFLTIWTLYAFYFSQWFILFTLFWKYINFLLQDISSTHKKESCYSGS